MSKELMEALDILGKEKNISKKTLLETIENSLISACKNNFGTADNVTVTIDPKTCDYTVIQEKEVVEKLEKPTLLQMQGKLIQIIVLEIGHRFL